MGILQAASPAARLYVKTHDQRRQHHLSLRLLSQTEASSSSGLGGTRNQGVASPGEVVITVSLKM